MSDKSGIEMLEELTHMVSRLEKRIEVMERNIKTIANTVKIAELVDRAIDTPLDGWARANKPTVKAIDPREEIKKVKEKADKMRFNFETNDAAKKKDGVQPARRGVTAAAAEPPMKKPSNIMCKGKMLVEDGSGKKVPIPDLSVKIFDEKDKLIKETKTNRAGHWMSQLPSGKYVACYEGEYKGQKLVSVNKNFIVPDILPSGQTFIEVN